MKASDFDKVFDEGKEDVLQYCDLTAVTRLNEESKRVNTDFPFWMVKALDLEAGRLGVSRQALIKMWIAEKLESRKS